MERRLSITYAYEPYYGLSVPDSWLRRALFVTGWFVLDTIWMAAVASVTPSHDRKRMAVIIGTESLALTIVYHFTHFYVTDDI